MGDPHPRRALTPALLVAQERGPARGGHGDSPRFADPVARVLEHREALEHARLDRISSLRYE